MKKKMVFILVIFMLFTTSCSNKDVFEMTYPEEYTGEYCFNNYVEADINLTFKRIADNRIGKYDRNAFHDTFYGAKDIPLEKFIFRKTTAVFCPEEFKVLKYKDCEDEPLMDYTVTKAELFWYYNGFGKNLFVADEGYMQRIGELCVNEIICTTTPNVAEHIREKIQSGDIIDIPLNLNEIADIQKIYKIHKNDGRIHYRLKLRLHFEEYNNLVWDATIACFERGEYFFMCDIDEDYSQNNGGRFDARNHNIMVMCPAYMCEYIDEMVASGIANIGEKDYIETSTTPSAE